MPPGRARGGSGRRRFGRAPRAPEDPASSDAARGRAIGLLARRDYAGAALARRLADSGFERPAAEAAVSQLEDERLVCDARYVEAAVASRIARGHGPVRIAHELRRDGVAASLIAEAVNPRDPDWATRAADVRRRRFGAAPPTEHADRTRQARFLFQRGFGGDHVRAALGARAAEDLDLEGAEAADLDDALPE